MTRRIAMWSGPRNISTAMMRAWENRDDCQVVDEPFYACYLYETGIDHPMRDAVIASQSTDWQGVAEQLSNGPVEQAIFYQKHMTHHIPTSMDLDWTKHVTHCFLIRNPFEVVNSYARKRESINEEDIGIRRQLALYREISEITGQDIPIVDARTILTDPASAMPRLCELLGVTYSGNMLAWPAGRRDTDGAWAPHWYQVVEQSTGFEPYYERELNLTPDQQQLAQDSMPAFETMLKLSG